MSKTGDNFETELRSSPTLTCIFLWFAGLTLCFISDKSTDAILRYRLPMLALLVCCTAAGAWLLERWRSKVGSWFMVFALVGLVILGNFWMAIPGFLLLLVIPVAFAGGFIGILAAAVTALAETLLLVLEPGMIAPTISRMEIDMVLISAWAIFGAICVIYSPIYHLNEWLSNSFRNTEKLLEDARDRQAALTQALEDLAHLSRQLVLMNERLTALRLIAEDAQKAKAAFVARVSHEFRTPLNMIIGLVNLMVDMPEKYAEEIPPQLFEDLQIVNRNCEHLSSMINDVLDLSQAEAGRLVLHREDINLSELIDSALEVVLPLIQKKRLGLQVTIQEGLPRVSCDVTRIRQVLINLVSNAARFTVEGRIQVKAVEHDQYIVIGVADTGPGIARDDAERLFQPFRQVSNRMGYDQGGSGLGLSISKQFIELHGGKIWLESEVGVGTSFFFKLPKSPSVEPEGVRGSWIREDWVWREPRFTTRHNILPAQVFRPRVVICDSSGGLFPELAHYAGEIEIVGTLDLTQAAQELAQCPTHVLMLNSEEPAQLEYLLQEAMRAAPGTPIIGCSILRSMNHAVKEGARGYLIKPVSRTDLEKAIQMVGSPIQRVLLVDDDAEFPYLLERMLYSYDPDLEITIASNGVQAIALLDQAVPDLVLLDVMMPGMNGWQVLDAIHRNEKWKDIPVFFVSAQDPAAGQPLLTPFLLATFGEGLAMDRLLQCSLEFSALMLTPDGAPGRGLG